MNTPDFWAMAKPGSLIDRWPKDSDGNPEKAVLLCHCDTLNMQDELKINMLEAYGIPVLRGYPGDGSFGKLILGISGNGADLHVPESMLEDALELCKGYEDEKLQ